MTAAPAVRVPPHDLDAESAVLGAILLDPAAIARVLDTLRAEDFYRENNGAIYRAATALFHEGEPIDNVSAAGVLAKMGVLERVGGRAHLALLQEAVPTAANIEHYARIVKDHSWRRQLVAASGQVAGLGYDLSKDAGDAVNEAQAAVFAVAGEQQARGAVRLHDLLRPAMERVDAQMAAGGGLVGLPSGFADLDRLTGGFQPGNLVILAARPGMGKTSWALNCMRHLSVAHGKPVVIYSLEMSADELVDRILCEQARIDSQRMKKGLLSEVEYDRLASALGPLGDAPLYIDDTPKLDDLSLRLRARQARSRHGVGLIVVDYLQLMDGRSGAAGDVNRVQEVSAISRALKMIARELEVPVLAISQLSRAPESRPDKRPMLSDLRDSGSLEQDADQVLFVYRDEVYTKEKCEEPGIAELILAKNRNGPTGTVKLLFKRELTRFESLERDRPSPTGDE